ncbi:MAG: hypothetical protein H6Q02_527 [Acidobacteria bacterium]|jgi:hypothetical protein|nr:hypothetical protein [Acidobacteriota bacterium]
MATAIQAMQDSAARYVGDGTVATPVIADRGDAAFVVVVQAAARLRLGDRFEFAGTTWEVTRAGDRLRGCVARPARRG